MYEEMTFEKIMESMLGRVRDDVDKREGSIIYDSTSTVAYSLAEMFFVIGNYMNLIFPDTSAGECLERFALAFNIERKDAVKSLRCGKFDKEIPIGTRFSTGGDKSLIFISGELLEIKDEEYKYCLECEEPGKSGNAYFGNIIPVEYISGLTVAELGEIITPGTDEESDESLRERLFAKIRKPSTSGNANDYYNWAMSCAGVGAAKVFPLADGPGTVKVVIASESKTAVDEALLKDVGEYIENVRPIGATVSVISASEKTVNVSAQVKLIKGTNLGTAQNEFQKCIEEYFNNSGLGIEYVSLARIGNILLNVTGIIDYTDLRLNGGLANVDFLPEEIALVGAVRLEVM